MGEAVFAIDDTFRRIAEHAEQQGKEIMLVKDQGIYLCAPGLLAGEAKPNLLCCYAKGCDPSTEEFDAWWDRCRDIAGGDDFAEKLDADTVRLFARAARDQCGSAVIELSETHMSIRVQ